MHIIIDGKEEALREIARLVEERFNGDATVEDKTSDIITVPSGLLRTRFKKDGKKFLMVANVLDNNPPWKEYYLIEHVVDDNLNVTDATMKRENEWFVDIRTSSSMYSREQDTSEACTACQSL